MQVLPSFKLSDFFVDAFRGKTQRIKKVIAASNPMRISFRGKEMVFCRYNYFRKIKKNHLEKLQLQQEKQEEELKKSQAFDVVNVPDSFKLAKTVLHQGSLMPLSPIVQPVLWPYGDCLHLYPHPDYLVLADECDDYYYTIPVNGHKTTHHDVTKLGNEDNHG